MAKTKAAEWNPELSSRYRTNRAIGRPKKRWEDDINEFLKHNLDEKKNEESPERKSYATWSLNKAAAVQRSRAMRTWTENDQEVSDGFSTRRNIWNTVTSCTKEQNLGPTAGTTAVLWYPAILLPGALVSPGLLAPPSGFRAPCCLRVLSVVLLQI